MTGQRQDRMLPILTGLLLCVGTECGPGMSCLRLPNRKQLGEADG